MPAAVLSFFGGAAHARGGKTALMWHRLRQESALVGRPIVCVTCRQPHDGPPRLGQCACGSALFGIQADTQLPLGLDLHGGEA